MRTMALPLSLTFGPKEDESVLYWALKGTCAFYEKHFGVRLTSSLYVLMWDGTLAGKAAHRRALPDTDYARDLRHQIAAARETAPNKCGGDAESKGIATWLVVGSIQFFAFNLWTGSAFHEHWEEVQVVGGALLHSKKGGDGYVDTGAKMDKIFAGVEAALA